MFTTPFYPVDHVLLHDEIEERREALRRSWGGRLWPRRHRAARPPATKAVSPQAPGAGRVALAR